MIMHNEVASSSGGSSEGSVSSGVSKPGEFFSRFGA